MKHPLNVLEGFIPYVYTDLYLSDTFETIWYDLGNICSNYGISRLAIFCFENALRHNRKSLKSLYRIGREFIFLNDYEKAAEVAKNVREFEESSFYFNVLIGHVYLSKNNLVKSHLHFSKSVRYDNRTDLLFLLGIAKWNELKRRHSVAFEHFSLFLKKYSAHVISFEVHFRIVSLCKFDGSIRYAIRLLKALEKEAGNVHKDAISVQLASCYELMDKDDVALKICKDILGHAPDYVFATRLIAFILLKNKKYQEMVRTLKRDDPYVLYLLGKAFSHLGVVDKAYDCFTAALNIQKYDTAFWNSFGMMYYTTGQIEDASYCFKSAILCDKTASEPLFNMIIINVVQGGLLVDIEESIASLLKRDPGDKELSEMQTLVRNRAAEDTGDATACAQNGGLFTHIKCRGMDVNLAFSPYFAAHLFFGGNVFNDRNDEHRGLDLRG